MELGRKKSPEFEGLVWINGAFLGLSEPRLLRFGMSLVDLSQSEALAARDKPVKFPQKIVLPGVLLRECKYLRPQKAKGHKASYKNI